MASRSYIYVFFMGTVLYVILFVLTWSVIAPHDPKSIQRLQHVGNGGGRRTARNSSTALTGTFPDNINKEHNRGKLCPFPKLNPFNPAVMKYIYQYPTVDCTFNVSKPSLVYLYKDSWLKVDKFKAMRLRIKFEACRYTQLKMKKGSDYDLEPYKWSERFEEIIHLNESDEFLYARCFYKGRIVSRSFITRFIKKPSIEEKAYLDYQKHLKTNTPLETLNILMVGLDGISKQAFERSCPRTRNFLLNDMKAKELHMHNKIGQNTFPNMIPFLTGKPEEDFFQQWTEDDKFDKVNHLFIWDEYKKAGYRTAFMTDVVWLSMFNYLKKGWSEPPCDYFFRPIPAKLYQEKRAGTMKEHCIGDIPEITLLTNYWIQLTTALNETVHPRHRRPATPYLAYSFLTRLTHDFASLGNRGDRLYLSFFEELKRRNTLHNTVLLVFSDHGGRFGKVREMYQGMLESRMPFFMFVFPQWFQEKYPEVMATFVTNQHRLTTNFDVHATLQDLMNFSGKTKVDSEDKKKQRGISLLREIPISRTCKHAGIPLKYCLCTRVQNTTISGTTSTIVVYTLYRHIASMTDSQRDVCATLKLKSIVSVLPVEPENESGEMTRFIYQTTIETTPGGGRFEATVSYNSLTYEGIVEGEVVRLNKYKGQDWCMPHLRYKQFCYCNKHAQYNSTA